MKTHKQGEKHFKKMVQNFFQKQLESESNKKQSFALNKVSSI